MDLRDQTQPCQIELSQIRAKQVACGAPFPDNSRPPALTNHFNLCFDNSSTEGVFVLLIILLCLLMIYMVARREGGHAPFYTLAVVAAPLELIKLLIASPLLRERSSNINAFFNDCYFRNEGIGVLPPLLSLPFPFKASHV